MLRALFGNNMSGFSYSNVLAFFLYKMINIPIDKE